MSKESDLTSIFEVLGTWSDGRTSADIAWGYVEGLVGSTGLKGSSGLAEVRQLGAVQAAPAQEATNVETFGAEVKQAKKRGRPARTAATKRPAAKGLGPEMKPVRVWLRKTGREDLISKSGFVKAEGRRLYTEAHPPKA